jgi:hypothetical protein
LAAALAHFPGLTSSEFGLAGKILVAVSERVEGDPQGLFKLGKAIENRTAQYTGNREELELRRLREELELHRLLAEARKNITKDVTYLAVAAYIHDIDSANISALEQFVRERYSDASEQYVAAVAQRMRENHERNAAQPMDEGLQAVIAVMGGRVELARSLGVKYRAVLDWRYVPVERLIQIERLTGIPCERLRPDLFPRGPQS